MEEEEEEEEEDTKASKKQLMIFRLPRTGRTQFSEHLGTVIIMWTELFLLLLTVLAAWLIKVYRAQWHWEKMGIMVR